MIFILVIATLAVLLAAFTYRSFEHPADLVNTAIGILLCMFTIVLVNIYLLTIV